MAESRLNVADGNSQSDLEEGEVESEQSSDDDYSPGSLVIDMGEDTSPPSSSGPPTPPISLTKHNLQYDTHPLLSPTLSHPSQELVNPVFSTTYQFHPQTSNFHFSNPHSSTIGTSADSAFSLPSSLMTNLPLESSSLMASQPHTFTPSQLHNVTPSQPHTFTPPHPHTFTPPQIPLMPITQPTIQTTSSSPAAMVTNPSDAVIPTQGADGVGVDNDDDGGKDGEREQVVRFVTKIGVASEGSPPIDTICVYHYKWCDATIDILTRIDKVTLIPIKNVYNRAIPGLKQNVLSARISKLGIRSLVLPEPYVSTLKKLNMGLTGSSHYITISDFMKICTYFRHPPPKNIVKFDFITSAISPEEVVKIFNDPSNEESQKLLSQLSAEAEVKGLKFNSSGGSGSGSGSGRGGSGSPGRGNKKRESSGSSVAMDETYNPSEVDTRRFILSDGRHIFLFVREGVAFIPNPELAKILPAVSRTAMEHIRSSYGITVYQASKAEIGVLKYLNVVSVKAGRTLVYRMTDVAKMFQHWKLHVPQRILEICEGKLPDDKVTVNIPPGHHWSITQPSLDHDGIATPSSRSRKRQRHTHSSKKTPPTDPTQQSPLWTSHHQTGTTHSPHYSKIKHENSNSTKHFSTNSSSGIGMGLLESAPHYSGMGMKPSVSNPSDSSPIFGNMTLTPERFQQPINMLSSMLMDNNSNASFSTGGHVTSTPDHVTGGASNMGFMSPSSGGSKLDDGQGQVQSKRRRSSTAASPLDDQNLEYSSLSWGEHILTLLCPANDGEPHLAIPELVKKVFHFRSYVSAQRRNDLGVVTLPASSLQIHALRARDSLDSIPGNTRLISLGDAVKLAVDGNFQIPGKVIQLLKKHHKESLDSILNPVPVMPAQPPGPSFRNIAPKEPTEEVVKTAPIAPSAHPDIINLGPEYRLADGIMCQVRWNDFKLVVYKTNKKVNYMGLYQIYETLFQQYVNRMNFKVRMRKLDIRSIRAPPPVRLKLIELNALPPNCPVCGLVKVSEVEHLAKSYGVVLPAVFTEELITLEDRAGKVYKQTKQATSRTGPQKVSINKKGKSRPNVFMYKFDEGQSSSTNQFLSPRSVPFMPGGQGSNQSYVVPYLTSSRDRLGTSSNNSSMTSPGVVMTSSGIMTTDQIGHSDSNSLIISIPRNLTPYKVTSQPQLFNINPFEAGGGGTMYSTNQKPRMKFGGSRGKVLQNLAKKITQKNRKFVSGGVGPGFGIPSMDDPSIEGSSIPGAGGRVCPTCSEVNSLSKKRCQSCNNFLVGRSCSSCGMINHNKNRECSNCGATLLFDWQREQSSGTHTQNDLSTSFNSPRKEGSVGGASDSSSHPTSPLSPKFSAPPIRNAVLKNMFPQSSGDTPTSLSGPASSGVAPGQQVTTKTIFTGNLASSRKCLECGQLNSRMAKKCLQCRSHLQGRPCHRCGRPNLNHVTECYKCGATLPVHANKWVYVGSHSGRAYKTQVQDPEERILKSRAPISCIRCHKLRSTGNFKCGRCGDVFKTSPLISPPWSEDPQDELINKPLSSLSSSLKRRRELNQRKTDAERAGAALDPSAIEQFGANILHLGISDKLTPLLLEVESESRAKIHSAEEELEAAENEYQEFLAKKEAIEKSYREAQLELNVLIAETECHNHKLVKLVEQEKQAKELVESLPKEISRLMERIKSAGELLTVH